MNYAQVTSVHHKKGTGREDKFESLVIFLCSGLQFRSNYSSKSMVILTATVS